MVLWLVLRKDLCNAFHHKLALKHIEELKKKKKDQNYRNFHNSKTYINSSYVN